MNNNKEKLSVEKISFINGMNVGMILLLLFHQNVIDWIYLIINPFGWLSFGIIILKHFIKIKRIELEKKP